MLELQALHPSGEHELPEACFIHEMSKLAVDLVYARVDFYLVKDKIYFGEITLTPGSGFEKFSDKVIDNEWLSYWN